jgi:predicted outer membrane repeat protein
MKKFTLLCCGCLITAALQAQIIHVPADFPTIQQGINAATSGDTILVADGLYYEQINFQGKKPLMVASEFLMDGDTNHINNTIIDGSHPTNPDSATIVYFVSGEDTTSILCGFTITGGRGTTIFSPEWALAREGGGIWIAGSGAKIRNNKITRNRCEDVLRPKVESDIGGAIATSFDQDNYWIVIEDNVIDSNYVVSDTSAGLCTGGGLAIFNNCRIINNTIKNNVGKNLVETPWWTQGVGATVVSIDTSLHKVAIIQNNLFLNNSNNSNKAFGGGMKVGSMILKCMNNTFSGNRVESDISVTDCWGAGMEAGDFLQGSAISGNIFINNYSEKTYGGLMLFSIFNNIEPVVIENNYFINNIAEKNGGALGITYCHALLQNNVFSGNHAGEKGGAIYLDCSASVASIYHHLAVMLNNSFSGNTATLQGGAVYSYFGKPLIINSIFWGDSATAGCEIHASMLADTVEIAYSNISLSDITANKVDGGGNFNSDPSFQDPVLLITVPWSLCVDAGVELYNCNGEPFLAPAYDITNVPRPAGSAFDIGAYELAYSCVGIHIAQNKLPIAAWPNPFSSTINFSYTLDEPSQVILRVFNNFGRLITEPINAFQQTGQQHIEWDAVILPAGIYYCRLQMREYIFSVKMIKLQ